MFPKQKKKIIQKIFEEDKLDITIQCNMEIVDYSDVSLKRLHWCKQHPKQHLKFAMGTTKNKVIETIRNYPRSIGRENNRTEYP